jgi:SnoaL-like domain
MGEMSDITTTERAGAVESTVRALYEAFRNRRRADAEALIGGTFTFTSPYDDEISRERYFERCWPNGDHFVHFEVERVAAGDNDAFVTYWCTTDKGVSFRNTEYLIVEGGQVTSVEVYFGASYRDGKFVTQQVGITS